MTAPRRFYKKAEAGTAPGGHVVRLDGKILKTPLGRNILFSSAFLAEEIAREWENQRDYIQLSIMPLTQLAYTLFDKAEDARKPIVDEIMKYAASDLVCYRAPHPEDLASGQKKRWDPLLFFLKDDFEIELKTVQGIQYLEQPEEGLKKFKSLIEGLSAPALTVMQAITPLTSSAVISFALIEGKINGDDCFAAATVDERFQMEKWGVDAEAEKKQARLKEEIEFAARFLSFFK